MTKCRCQLCLHRSAPAGDHPCRRGGGLEDKPDRKVRHCISVFRRKETFCPVSDRCLENQKHTLVRGGRDLQHL